jgi:hypothetical protein
MRPLYTFAVCAILAFPACGDETTGPAPATQLVFSIQPANDTVSSPLATVVVTALTAQGSFATGFTGTVTLTLGANPGGATLSGTLSAAATAGVAQFPNVTLNKAEDGYTLTATSGSLSVTSATFDVSEVVTRYPLRYYYGLDLETGATVDCDISAPPCPAAQDFRFGYYSPSAPHAWFVTFASRTIATLTGRGFADVHLADTAGASFAASSGTPFLGTHTFLIRTNAGNVYKLGNPAEFGTGGADSVRFQVARLN